MIKIGVLATLAAVICVTLAIALVARRSDSFFSLTEELEPSQR